MADSGVMVAARKQPKRPPAADALTPPPRGAAFDDEEVLAASVALALDDLVRDANGEVVLFNDSGQRALAIATHARVLEEGEVGRHVTAAGEDVSGFRFLVFDNGLKLYHPPGLDLILVGRWRGG
jgi:hypothetical protein